MRIPPLPELEFAAVAPLACGLEGNRMCFMRAGRHDAPPVLLMHGVGSSSTGWRFVLDALAPRYHVIAWNAPGYFLSDNLAAPQPTAWQYADAAAALLDALGIDRIFLAGSSFGSMVAASFAARHPRRVRRLALSGCSRGTKSLPPEEQARSLRAREESIRDGALAMAATRWRSLVGEGASPTVIRLTQELLKATNRRGFVQATAARQTTDLLEFADKIVAPTLMIVGSEDQVNPPVVSRAVNAALPNSRLVELDGVGHLPKLECPERTAQLLGDHFGDAP